MASELGQRHHFVHPPFVHPEKAVASGDYYVGARFLGQQWPPVDGHLHVKGLSSIRVDDRVDASSEELQGNVVFVPLRFPGMAELLEPVKPRPLQVNELIQVVPGVGVGQGLLRRVVVIDVGNVDALGRCVATKATTPERPAPASSKRLRICASVPS